MKSPIGYRANWVGCVFSVAMVFACRSADAQAMAERLHIPSGIGTTVSVATLRLPEKAWKHFAKAKAAAERRDFAEADRETEQAISIAPDFAEAYILRADSLVQEHFFEAAIASVKEARRVEPEVMWGGVVLAGAYNGLHRYEDARLVLRELQGAEASTWQAAYESARSAIGMNDGEGALRWSALALAAAPPGFLDVRLVRTNAFLLAHRWSDAQAQMEMYLESTEKQEHRAQVLIALEHVKQLTRAEELQKLASRQ